jgi:signal transduction histidine kinase
METPSIDGQRRLVIEILHDLRNRLNVVVLEAQDLRERLGEHLDEKELAGLQTAIQQMSERFKQIRESAEPSPAILVRIPARELDELAFTGLRKEFPLASWEVPALEGEVEIDLQQFPQALRALLQNAMEAGEEARIRVAAAKDALTLTVANPAAGTPVSLEKWGKSFHFSTKRGHLGFGCFYAAEVIRQHNGRVEWSHDPAGKTVSVRVNLPR